MKLAVCAALFISVITTGCGADTKEDLVSCKDPVDWEAWRSERLTDNREELTARQSIGDRVVACDDLVGMSSRQLRRLLGKPVSVLKVPDRKQREFEYYVGPERGEVSLDDEFMWVVVSTETDLVVGVEVGPG